MKHLGLCMARRALRHKEMISRDVAPFLRSCHPQTVQWITSVAPNLRKYLSYDSPGDFSVQKHTLSTVVRAELNEGDLTVSLQAIDWLERVSRRMAKLPTQSLNNVSYKFQVGDVVINRRLGHRGVVAACLPICFESDNWIESHLGSMDDPRMLAPWYLILVGRHEGLPLDFSRYGSELTHRKSEEVLSVGMNRFLPVYFEGFDTKQGRYIPRKLDSSSFRRSQFGFAGQTTVDARSVDFSDPLILADIVSK